ncbi:MAG: GerMN domain-containing protein [Lachnospiraceae bacterium]|nr:GerMN domain-containing protein [Lachnospiraceae bacterium]
MSDKNRENSYRKQKKIVHSLFFHALWAVLLTLVLLSGMTGCAREEKEDSGLLLYYLNEDLSSLNTLSYLMEDGKSKADLSPQEMADDMLEQLATPSGDVRSIAPIQNFTVTGTTLQNGTLTVFLSSDYEELETVREILTRAALVNTLCQIDGVDSVSFLCGDHPLTNEDGSVVTAMNSDMFIFNSGKEIMNYEKVRLHLYFANEDGDQLVDTYRNVVYNSNISMERLVVEQVLKGPNSDVVFPTLNPAAKVLSVTTRDGVCYVNLDQAFLTEPYGVTSQVAIYSLVNSLTELSSVSAVQITIEGKTGKAFMDSSLSSAFERNLSVVRKNETR